MRPDWQHLSGMAKVEVQRTLASLPRPLRAAADLVPVTFEPHPSPEQVADGLEADILGAFLGEAFPDEENSQVNVPPRVLLFLENLWDFAEADEELYRREVRTTLLHELGHYLGLDESDLESRGME